MQPYSTKCAIRKCASAGAGPQRYTRSQATVVGRTANFTTSRAPCFRDAGTNLLKFRSIFCKVLGTGAMPVCGTENVTDDVVLTHLKWSSLFCEGLTTM